MKFHLLPLAGILTPTLLAQGGTVVPITQSQGMFAGFPVGIQHDRRDPLLAHDPHLQIRTGSITNGILKDPGQTPQALPGPSNPDYSPTALFSHWLASHMPNVSQWNINTPGCILEFGGFSTGGDVCPPVNAAGRLQMDANSDVTWYVLSMAVGEGAQGEVGSQVRVAGADASGYIFSYGVEDSEGIDDEFVDAVRVEYTRSQMNIGASRAITGMDWGMGIISRTPYGEPTAEQPVRTEFYFTVALNWILANGSDLDPLVVYHMHWEQVAGVWGWSEPVIAFDRPDLFAAAAVPTAASEIDALSVYVGGGPHDAPDRVVFSLSRESRVLDATSQYVPLNQILVSQRATAGEPLVQAMPLRVQGGDLMTRKFGLIDVEDSPEDPDNVRGLCGRDPRERDRLDLYAGRPMPDASGGTAPHGIGLSFLRCGVVPTHGEEHGDLLLQVTGIDLPPTQVGFVVFDLEAYEDTSTGSALRWSDSTDSQPIQVPLGELTFAIETPFSLVTESKESGDYELRARARLHRYDLVSGAILLNTDDSCWSSLLLVDR